MEIVILETLAILEATGTVTLETAAAIQVTVILLVAEMIT